MSAAFDEKLPFDEPGTSSRSPSHARVDSKNENESAKHLTMASGSTRYVRYILFAVVGLAILYFISSSSLPTYTPPVSSTGSTTNKPVGIGLEKPYSSADFSSALANPPRPTPETTVRPGTTPNVKPDEFPRSQLSPPAPGDRVNATFVTLARNSDLWEIARSIRQVEDRFNRNYNYDWVFLNDKPFDDGFKKVTSALVSGKTHYGLIPEEHWSFPSWIDQKKAEAVREDMRQRKIIYGDSISYRHMCRYESGFFFRHPVMNQFEYYWRVEPSVELFCDVHYDPFRFMKDNKKKYSFVLSLYEYVETIPTLWDSVKKFTKDHPEHIHPENSMAFLSDDGGDTYNKCHFWSNFEIGNLDWLRSPAYLDFFNSLDRDGGFFYERWGDAPVHSIGAGLTLHRDEIHFFNDIAYYHVPFTHCPTGEDLRLKLRCHCNPKDNFDWKGYSCTSRYYDLNKIEKPKGWSDEV